MANIKWSRCRSAHSCRWFPNAAQEQIRGTRDADQEDARHQPVAAAVGRGPGIQTAKPEAEDRQPDNLDSHVPARIKAFHFCMSAGLVEGSALDRCTQLKD